MPMLSKQQAAATAVASLESGPLKGWKVQLLWSLI